MPDDAELLPIFPLSNVVLFPRIQAPLHLFEPRYRQLGERALAGDRRIGMVVVRPDHVDEIADDPPVFPVGCAGDVRDARRRPDGRYDIVLEGIWRFRIVGEEPRPAGRLFRVARVRRLEERAIADDAQRVAQLRERVVEQVCDLVRRSGSSRDGSFDPSLFEGVDDETFVNALANGLGFPTAEKQGLLESDGPATRLERLDGLLAFHLAQLSLGVRDGDRLH